MSEPSRRLRRQRLTAVLIGTAVVLLVVVAFWWIGGFDSGRYRGFFTNVMRLIGEFLPPDPSAAGSWWGPIVETLAMAVAATGLAAVGGLFGGVLTAPRTMPIAAVRWPLRFLLQGVRTVPDLIWAVLLCVAVGAGPVAGMFALFLHSVGVLGKHAAELCDHADGAPIDAIRSTGAHPLQVIHCGVLPQIMPLFNDQVLYRFEVNIRMALVLGFVGAGGLGQELLVALRVLDYDDVAAQVLVVVILVGLVDATSGWCRRRLLGLHGIPKQSAWT